MATISDKVEMVHACGAHTYKYRDKDIQKEWWRLTNAFQYMVIPKEEYKDIAERAVEIALLIADTDTFLYSRSKRWTGYSAINNYMVKYGVSVEEAILNCGGGYFDCSSFILSCYKFAGLPYVGTWKTYTGGMKTVFRKCGCFDIYATTDYTRTDEKAERGSVYWKENAHTIMAINAYNEDPEPEPPEPEPEPTTKYVQIISGSYNVRASGSSKGAKLGVAKKGDIYSYLGAAESGWHKIQFGLVEGYITNAYPEKIKVVDTEDPEPLPPTTDSYVEIINGTMSIRKSNSTVSKRIGVASKSQKYDVYDVTPNNWYKVMYEGQTGYISGNTENTILVNIE